MSWALGACNGQAGSLQLISLSWWVLLKSLLEDVGVKGDFGVRP